MLQFSNIYFHITFQFTLFSQTLTAVKLTLCLIIHLAMNMHGSVAAYLPIFLKSALYGQ